MTTLSLQQAATEAGVSKSTIFRAIKAGRLSAERTADGNFAIDPAELFRVYPQPSRDVPAAQGAMPEDPAVAVRLAQLETELRALREMLTEAREQRDRWAEQAEDALRRVALPSPNPVPRRGLLARLWG